ncbi:hypothetical protein OK016_26525 [Vibrio chagasii]|nr:hypothetical protein [Vibrio chagasii]
MAYAGLESGDPVVLDIIKKRMTPEQAIGVWHWQKMQVSKLYCRLFLDSAVVGVPASTLSRQQGC